MFRWDYTFSIEVEASIEEAWSFFANPSHWPKWEKRFDTCFLTGDFEPGAQVKAKIKDRPIHVGILITDVKPYSEYRALMGHLVLRQESLTTFKELFPGKTQVTFQVCALSPFVPFIKSVLLKNVEQVHVKVTEAFLEYSQQGVLKGG